MRSTNPVLKNSVVFKTRTTSSVGASTMSVDGTLAKLAFMLLFVMASAAFTWNMTLRGSAAASGWMWGGFILGLLLALVISFKPLLAPVLAIPYALAEGLFLGGISGMYHSFQKGIAVQAVMLTIAIAATMAFVYRMRWIKVTERFRSIMFMAVGAIMLVYVASWIMRLFGATMPFLHSTGPIGIGISIVLVVVASLFLLVDFDMIERGAQQGAPKQLEWFGAFALLVTLVWLYLEVLRLLAKLQSRD